MAAEKAAAAFAMSVGSQEPCADGVLPFRIDSGSGLLLSPGRRCVLAALRTAPVGTTLSASSLCVRGWSDEKEAQANTRHVEVRTPVHFWKYIQTFGHTKHMAENPIQLCMGEVPKKAFRILVTPCGVKDCAASRRVLR